MGVYEVICEIREVLGRLNPHTREFLKQKELKEQEQYRV